LSGGEKIRLAFARLLIRPPNLRLLDEPTTQLDIESREALETALSEYEGTICLVSHDIEFVRRVAGGIVAMTPPGITRYPGGYDYYREKMTQLERTAAAAAPDPKREDRERRKADKRERAMKIQADAKQRRALEKAVKQAEQKLAELETEQADLVARLSGPDTVDYAAVNQRLAAIQEEIAAASTQWETAALELEKRQKDEG
jgi:ATP-binding cassette subfamily F protein 3